MGGEGSEETAKRRERATTGMRMKIGMRTTPHGTRPEFPRAALMNLIFLFLTRRLVDEEVDRYP